MELTHLFFLLIQQEAASSAAAMAGLSIQQILARAGWSFEDISIIDQWQKLPLPIVLGVMLQTCKPLKYNPWMARVDLATEC